MLTKWKYFVPIIFLDKPILLQLRDEMLQSSFLRKKSSGFPEGSAKSNDMINITDAYNEKLRKLFWLGPRISDLSFFRSSYHKVS